MLRVTLKGLLAHKFRVLATGLAVILGVAFMAGTLVLTDTIGKTFDDLFADVYEDTDAVVRAEAAFDNPDRAGEVRGRIPDSLLGTVAAVDGVAAAEGVVQGYAQLVDHDGDPIGDPVMGAPTFGGNWGTSDELNPFDVVAGTAPEGDDEIVIDKKSAEDGDFAVGDEVTVLVQGPPQTMRVAGIATFAGADSPGGASFVLFTTPVAQRLVAQEGTFDSISVLGDGNLSQDELVGRLAAAVPDGVEVVSGEAITVESQDDIREDLSFFNVFMLIFAAIALLVGSFIIFNTFSITVAQRTRENALLRAIGATRRQVLTSVLVEAFVIGVIASLVGLGAGVLVAAALKALLAGFGVELPAGGVVLTARTVVVAMVVGVLVTVVAAVSPARKAGKVPPVAALRDVALGSTGYGSKLRIGVGLGLLVLGVLALMGGLFGGGDNPLPIVMVGVLLVFFGVSVLGRTVALPLSRILGAPLPRLRGISGRLARENAMRNPKRTAATASALMIGVGLIGFITILAASTRASINDTIEKAFTGDLVVDSGLVGFGGLDPGLAANLNELPEVRSATGVRMTSVAVEGDAQQIIGVDPATAFEVIDVDPKRGAPADLDRDAIAVHEDEAEDRGLDIGDPVSVVFKDTGPTTLTVAMIYGEDQPIGTYFVGLAAYEANVTDQYDFQVWVAKADGVSLADATAAVEDVAAGYPGAEVLDEGEYKAAQTETIDQLLGLIYALLALAILIALMGIANTLILSILERTRELSLLRAVGMTRGQLRSTIRWESVIIALQGTLLGLVIGTFFGWALVVALHDEGITRFSMPFASLAIIVVLAGIAGVIAAIPPARRAAKLDILRGVTSE